MPKLPQIVTLFLVAVISAGCDRKPEASAPPESDERPTSETRVPWKLPGVETVPESAAKKMESALEEKMERGGPFRTEHLDQGVPLYTNRLVLEASPYLQQHAHNPVNWFPWGDEAFQKAAAEKKPVLLSVGYSTCHWCHVMERESFEDVEIARYLNENYVAVKVDREERPDIDDTYMEAVQMMTGRGGWPMTVWLTPDRLPFMGGTYFPPRAGDRGARKGFYELLQEMRARYDEEPAAVASRAQELALGVRRSLQPSDDGGEMPDPVRAMEGALLNYERTFDETYGGFGRHNKFPMPSRLRFLLRYHRRTGEKAALEMTTKTLDAMANAGIYDHVGGGFHRYATDPRWMTPHFEKMLYDNAQLVTVYTEAWQVTSNEEYRRVVEETLTYLRRDMTNDAGAFYSATDADSEGEEGRFFVWTPAEIDAALEPEAARLVKAYYQVTDSGNFEGRNILHTPRPTEAVAAELGTTPKAFEERLEAARATLYEAREDREHPLRDEKILAAWNGLTIDAFARASLTFGEEEWARAAERAADFLLEKMRRSDGRLVRTRIGDRLGPDAFSEDYTFVIAGLLTLFEATSDSRWLESAVALQKLHLEHYWDDEAGGFFQTAHDAETLLVRKKADQDGALPSANSVAALNLLRLYQFTLEESWERRAVAIFELFGSQLEREGASLPMMLAAFDFHDEGAREIAIVEPSPSAPNPLIDRYRRSFQPNSVVVWGPVEKMEGLATKVPWLRKKTPRDEKTTAYVCKDFVCKFPTNDPETFAEQISEVDPLGAPTR